MKSIVVKSIVAAALTVGAVAALLAQEHPISHGTSAAIDARLVTENEFVQIYRMAIPAHVRTPMHDVTPRVVVWLSDAHFADRYDDGKSVEETRRAGDVEWVSARRHSGENLADRPMQFVAVVLKGAAGDAHQPPRGHDRR